jgi:hypothetical protein
MSCTGSAAEAPRVAPMIAMVIGATNVTALRKDTSIP